MMVAHARAICAHVELIEHEPHRDATALEAVARWLLRFSPIVSLGSAAGSGQSAEDMRFQGFAAHPRDQLRVTRDKPSEHADQRPAIYLDLTGCQYVFGSYEVIVDQIASAMNRFGVRASIVVAPTVGAAYALSFSERWNGRVLPPLPPGEGWGEGARRCQSASSLQSPLTLTLSLREREQDWQTALDRLPPFTLRIPDETAASLTHLGINTIGLLRRLPREELPARFGPLLIKRLNQALGVDPEPLKAIRPIEPIESGVEYDFGVDSIESLWGVIHQQLDALIAQLLRRGHGARLIEFDLLLQNHTPITRSIELSRPTRDRKRIVRLVRISLEQAASPPRQSRKKTRARDLFGARFTGVRFRVIQSLRIRDEQIALLERDDISEEIALADLIERLALRLPEGVRQAEPVEAYVPEKAWGDGKAQAQEKARRHKGTKARRKSDPSSTSCIRVSMPPCLSPPNRPLLLSPFPDEIAVIVSPSHDRDGRPIGITMKGQHHRVVHARGPERIAGQWWAGHNKTRDYFDIELDTAIRLWVFRVVENGRWFVQGNY